MTEDLVRFRLPATFVAERVFLRPSEIACGYERGWLDPAAVVAVAERALGEGRELTPEVEALALLLGDELDRVSELVGEIPRHDGAEPQRVWLYLILEWLYRHRAEFSDPLEVIEMLYADFGYPAEIEGFVRYMPPPEGEPVGPAAIEQRWREYLTQRAGELAERP